MEATPVDTTEAPLATETVPAVATELRSPSPTVVLPTETIDAATRIAPANLTLTAIRETAAVLAERSTARAATTLETMPVDTAEAPLETETVPAAATETQEPAPTVVRPTATIEDAATRYRASQSDFDGDPRNGARPGGALNCERRQLWKRRPSIRLKLHL